MKNLKPELVWGYFHEITQVPRPSKKEEKIRKYLRDFAAKHKLECKEDKKGNIVIIRESAPEYKNQPAIILQSHMDMVCENETGLKFDFDKQPIDAYIDGDWVRARGTTLGADCGIGMALQMAVVTDPTIKTRKIEALFTVDEEQGLTGAKELGADMLTGSEMLNLDSEDEGEIFIGCAGGIDTVATFNANLKAAPSADKYEFHKIVVGGLKGGHSGDDIEKGLAAATKVLTRLLWMVSKRFDALLCDINAGNLRNAIARDGYAVVALPKAKSAEALKELNKLGEDIKNEFHRTEPDMSVKVEKSAAPKQKIDSAVACRLISALQAAPHGVQAMSQSIEGLVETSTNLASVKIEGGKIVVSTSQRSSSESAKYDIANTVKSVFLLADADIVQSDGYPGWAPNPDSPLVKKSGEVYKMMFGKAAKIKAIHAGLEAGLFLTKYPKLDIISFGPTVRGAHSPTERVEIKAVDMVWKYLKKLLEEMAK